jgi:ribosomal-protein-alanine N-acetyltransferase
VPIRSATLADIPQIVELERAVPEAAHWPAAQYESALTDLAVFRVLLVSEDESQLDGFLVARQIGLEWELENLAVSSTRRRKGVGRQLLDSLIQISRAHSGAVMFLEVRVSNFAARALYEKCGFIHSGSRPRYYQSPEEDAALYRLIFD